MATPRRRLLRLTAPPVNSDANAQRQLHNYRSKLERERLVLARWLCRLKRAFHTFEKSMARVSRLEQHLAKLEAQAQGRPTR
jgi:hypothetical protein